MATFEKNSDGSTTIKLGEPVNLNGEDTSRCVIPALKGKHLMRAPFRGAEVAIGQLVEFAGAIVTPKGIVEELCVADAMAVAAEVARLLGEAQATGKPPSR